MVPKSTRACRWLPRGTALSAPPPPHRSRPSQGPKYLLSQIDNPRRRQTILGECQAWPPHSILNQPTPLPLSGPPPMPCGLCKPLCWPPDRFTGTQPHSPTFSVVFHIYRAIITPSLAVSKLGAITHKYQPYIWANPLWCPHRCRRRGARWSQVGDTNRRGQRLGLWCLRIGATPCHPTASLITHFGACSLHLVSRRVPLARVHVRREMSSQEKPNQTHSRRSTGRQSYLSSLAPPVRQPPSHTATDRSHCGLMLKAGTTSGSMERPLLALEIDHTIPFLFQLLVIRRTHLVTPKDTAFSRRRSRSSAFARGRLAKAGKAQQVLRGGFRARPQVSERPAPQTKMLLSAPQGKARAESNPPPRSPSLPPDPPCIVTTALLNVGSLYIDWWSDCP